MERMQRKITSTFVENLKSAKDIIIRDTEIPGFYFHYKKEQKSKKFYFRYRAKFSRKEHNIKIARFGEMKFVDIVNIARDHRTKVLQGHDPVFEMREAAQKQMLKEKSREKLHTALKEYIDVYSKPNKRSYKSDESFARKITDALGESKRLDEFCLHDAVKLKNDIGQSSHANANHVISLISSFLRWCEEMGKITRDQNFSHSKLLQKFYIAPRNRVISEEEYGHMFAAFAEGRKLAVLNIENPAYTLEARLFDALELLVLTGCRLSEIVKATWDNVDLGYRCLRYRYSKTKEKTVSLSDRAFEILSEIYKNRIKSSPFVFPSHRDNSKPISGLRAVFEFVCKEAKFDKSITIHTLRHSFTTTGCMVESNAITLQQTIGHKSLTTTEGYIHIGNKEKIKLANSISNKILSYAVKSENPEKAAEI
jgi:integrase